MAKAIYITRCDIGWYSKNANAYRKPLEVVTKYETTIVVPDYCRVPKEIAEKCAEIVRFKGLCGLLQGEFLTQRRNDAEDWEISPRSQRPCDSVLKIFTGFDFPCMLKAWRLKSRFGCKWTIFLWDPPSLSHRDGFPPLRWAIDAVFRFFAKRCDKLVLNIHPGLLDEIGYKPREGQIELRMQDAFEGMDFSRVTSFAEATAVKEHEERVDEDRFEYDFGVLANWENGKGGPLMAEALVKMPGKKCLWIGDPPSSDVSGQITFVGRKSQDEAFAMLKRCRVLVVPYLATHAFKWNYPLKLFEYLKIGRPVLASDNPGNVAIAKRYKGRIEFFKSGDVDDFVAVSSVVGKA